MMRLPLVLAFALSTVVVAAIDNKVFPLKLSRIDTLAPSPYPERFSSNSVPLLNNYNFYTINVTFGSDKQELSLNVGTGTGDTRVPAKGSDACTSNLGEIAFLLMYIQADLVKP